jgi:hypothetical protein
MGKFFLNRVGMVFFDFCVVLHFISILISYSLAGPTAWAQLFGLKDYKAFFISPFVIVLALLVIFGYRFIRQIITWATLAKGSLLVIMVVLVGVVGFTVDLDSWDNWRYVGQPFLIGTVALGGAMNTLPVIYSKMIPTARNIRMFRFAAVSAMIVCGFLNIAWVLFVLKIVPQEDVESKPSLDRSSKRGEISTVPLIEIINKNFPEFNWLAWLVQFFIILSITVSFVTISSGLKHMLDGYVKTFNELAQKKETLLNRITEKLARVVRRPDIFFQFLLYFINFALILIVAQVNPSQFFIVMEVFTSAALNLESGVFVALMLWTSTRRTDIQIPVPLPRWCIHTLWIVGAYFLFAVLYDIVYHVAAIFVKPMPF